MSFERIHRFVPSSLAIRVATLGLCAAAGLNANAQTFTNASPITIPESGAASLYPSAINVSGVSGSLEHITVTVSNFSHTFPSDVIMLLVAPTGQMVTLTSRCGGNDDAVGATLTFDDSAISTLASPVVTGTFQTAQCIEQTVPGPGPAGPYASDLAVLQGINPNGTWRLYVADMVAFDSGSIAGGWSISFSPANDYVGATAFTYQGVLTDNGSPRNGPVNAQFFLYDSETNGQRIGPPLHRSLDVNNGLLTTWLDYGDAPLSATSPRWLQVIVDGQPQTPRQSLMNAPTATKAIFAETAKSATSAMSAASAQTVPWGGITGVPANVGGAFSPWLPSGASILFPGAVGVGTNNFPAMFNVGASSNIATYVVSPSAAGTWSVMHNDTASAYWQVIATGTANGGGANDLVIATGSGITSTSGAVLRLFSSTNYVGVGLPSGTPATQRLHVNGNVLANNVAVPSSIRFKDHVVPMDDALARLLKLEGVRFDWKPEWAKDRPGREHDIGFVAEDVAKEFPEVVFYDADGNVTGMDYSRMTAVAIEAIKQQQAKFDAELAKRDAENAELRARLERLERALAN